MKIINLPCYGIQVVTDGEGSGTISSDMKCSPDPEGGREEEEQADRFNDMMDALESMILGHACAGVDIESPAYLEGIETSVNVCAKETE
jgi:hypothetical protein